MERATTADIALHQDEKIWHDIFKWHVVSNVISFYQEHSARIYTLAVCIHDEISKTENDVYEYVMPFECMAPYVRFFIFSSKITPFNNSIAQLRQSDNTLTVYQEVQDYRLAHNGNIMSISSESMDMVHLIKSNANFNILKLSILGNKTSETTRILCENGAANFVFNPRRIMFVKNTPIEMPFVPNCENMDKCNIFLVDINAHHVDPKRCRHVENTMYWYFIKADFAEKIITCAYDPVSLYHHISEASLTENNEFDDYVTEISEWQNYQKFIDGWCAEVRQSRPKSATNKRIPREQLPARPHTAPSRVSESPSQSVTPVTPEEMDAVPVVPSPPDVPTPPNILNRTEVALMHNSPVKCADFLVQLYKHLPKHKGFYKSGVKHIYIYVDNERSEDEGQLKINGDVITHMQMLFKELKTISPNMVANISQEVANKLKPCAEQHIIDAMIDR